MALNIDAFDAAAAISGTDKFGVAQGDAEMKRALVSALLTYISANIGTAFTRTILDDAAAGDVLTTLGVSAFVKTILDDAAAGNVLTTLGVSAFLQTLLDDSDAQAARATLGVEVVDSVIGTYVTNADITATIPIDDTKPQIGEGVEIITVSITPKNAANKLRATLHANGATSGGGTMIAALFAAGGADALAVDWVSTAAADRVYPLGFVHEWTPGVTTAVTVAVRVGVSGGTMRLNGISTARRFGGALSSVLVVEEIQA